MSILNKIFGGGEPEVSTAPGQAPECGHRALIPRWDDAADMGKREKISRYYCEGCGSDFSVAEAERFHAEPI